jgi:mannose-6-phosphate isomerase-like protein (cupin superfamily)
MIIARADQRKLEDAHGPHGGAGTIRLARLLDHSSFQTPWNFVHTAVFPPGTSIGHHRHDNSEEIFVTVDNEAQFTHNGRTAQIVGPAAVPLRDGESHGIHNHTNHETTWFNFNVFANDADPSATDFGDDRIGAALESVDRLPVGRLDRGLLAYDRRHSGRGAVGRREVWGPRDFRTNLAYLVHCLLPADTSIGYHRHEGLEECYVIMNGQGSMTVDEETAEVQPCDVIPILIGSVHGIYNPTDADLELFIVGVCMKKGQIDGADLDDDLASRSTRALGEHSSATDSLSR